MAIWHCIALLALLTAVCSAGRTALLIQGFGISETFSLFWRLSFGLIVALWVNLDRKVQKFDAPFDFDFFVFFLWAFVIPYYLYRTRGRTGLLYAVGVYGLYLAPPVVATMATLVR